MSRRVEIAILPAALLGSFIVACLGLWVTGVPALQPVVAYAQAQPTPAPAAPPAEDQPSAQPVEAVAAPTGECPLAGAYPEKVRRWCDLIDRHAAENELDPNLVAAVMLQESGGDPQAYSKSGAVGLLQVMPRDGLAASFQCVNGPCFASRPTIAELEDPEFNLAYGTRMLAGLIRKTGDMREALKSYGPANVGYYYSDIILRIYDRYR